MMANVGVPAAYIFSHDKDGSVPHRRLADMPVLGRALGGRGLPFETPLAGGIAGREALRRCRVFMGNLVLK
jgi:hypothetical protein